MDLTNIKFKLGYPPKIKKFKEEILKKLKIKAPKQKSELSLSHLSDIAYRNNNHDKDKISLEYLNYIDRDIFNKKFLRTQSGSFFSKFPNIPKKEINRRLLINKDNLFANKLIRNSNKIKEIQISIFEQEISTKSLLTTKKNNILENKYQIIQDDKNDVNPNNSKSKILKIIRTQTRSNFNNKYRLMFKSSNKKKRNDIQNYFSLIKKDMKFDYEPIIATNRKVYTFKENNIPEFGFKKKEKIKINRDIFRKNNFSNLINNKKKLIFIPILNPNKRRKEDSKIKV